MNNECDSLSNVPDNIMVKKATNVDETLQILLEENKEADLDCAAILASAFST